MTQRKKLSSQNSVQNNNQPTKSNPISIPPPSSSTQHLYYCFRESPGSFKVGSQGDDDSLLFKLDKAEAKEEKFDRWLKYKKGEQKSEVSKLCSRKPQVDFHKVHAHTETDDFAISPIMQRSGV